MLTFDDCLGLCGLSKGEIDAIAEHEHVPTIIAAEMAHYLCQNAAGERCIRQYILDDIATAEKRSDTRHVESLRAILLHFVKTHPRAQE